jgi:hypothetical protein
MPYPTRDEFVDLLKTRRHSDLVDEHLLAGIPFAFEASPHVYDLLRDTLSKELRSQTADITVIGSGRIGFSLDPDKFGKPYQQGTSDIDTVIVSERMFDVAWYQMASKGRSVLNLQFRVRQSFDEHRQNNIFFGYIQPERLIGVITLSALWFRTFNALALVPELAALDVQGRLYRTWDHVKIHQLYSLNRVAEKLGI